MVLLQDGSDIRIPVSKLLDDAVTRCIVFGTESDQPEDNVDLILALGDKIIEYQEKLEDKQFVDIEGAVKIITLIDCLISKDQLELVKVIKLDRVNCKNNHIYNSYNDLFFFSVVGCRLFLTETVIFGFKR